MAMQRKYGCGVRTTLIHLVALFTSISATPQPFVFWTMDRYSGTRLIPENNADTRFQGDFSSLSSDVTQVLRDGIVGKALYVSEDSFDLIENIRNDCIRDVDECAEGGLSMVFWLKIEQWNGGSFQVIFRSTTATKTLAGVYLAKGSGETLEVYVRSGSGQSYRSEFSASYVWNTWSLIGLTWGGSDKIISVYVNGTNLNIPTTVNSVPSRSPTVTDFVVGSSLAPTFYLDEFRIYYQTISADDMSDIHAADTRGLSPTTIGEALSTSPDTTTPAVTTTTDAASTTPVTLSTSSATASTTHTVSTTAQTTTSTDETTTTSASTPSTTTTSKGETTTTVSIPSATTTTTGGTTTTGESTPTTTTTSTEGTTTPTSTTTSTGGTTTTTVSTPTTTSKSASETTDTEAEASFTATSPTFTTSTTYSTTREPDPTNTNSHTPSSNTATTRSTATTDEETPFWRRVTFLAIVIPAGVVLICVLVIVICICRKRRSSRRA